MLAIVSDQRFERWIVTFVCFW